MTRSDPEDSSTVRNLSPGDIEYELGVPIPGTIVPQESWAKTAMHRLPDGWIDWEQVFGRQAKVVLDIGCGNGRFVVSSAVRRPEVDHIGIDILPVVIRYATRRGKERGLANTRFAVCGGEDFLEHHVAPGTIAEIHIYHPQPYHDPRERHLRLFHPNFFRLIHRALPIGGQLFLQTDSQSYWDYLTTSVRDLLEWEERQTPWEEDPLGRSRREIIASQQGCRIFRGSGTKRMEWSEADWDAWKLRMPMPTFRTQRPPRRRGSSRSRPPRRRP